MYSLRDYGWMISDDRRTAAYAESLKKQMTSSSVVVEIGTGTGIFALLAARLGARKVYAIESSDAIQYARNIAAANGLAGRIEFIQALSTQVQLPERADIIVSELHGVLPPFQRSLSSIMDARDRFLAPGGCIIPRRETLWAALVESSATHHEFAGVWGSDVYGIDMTSIRPTAVNSWRKCQFQSNELVTQPERWAVLDYSVLRGPHVHGEAAWEIREDRTAHGVCAWFDWDGAEGVIFSNSPLSAERHIFGQAFFPWPEPVRLRPSDQVRVTLRIDLVGSNYVQGWETIVISAEGSTRATFRQSDFLGTSLSPDGLRKQASTYIPALNENGRIECLILGRMGSGASLEQIAREASERFPHVFATWTDALARVGELSLRYGSE